MVERTAPDMTETTTETMMRELTRLGECFWAGEAEIARDFLSAPHEPRRPRPLAPASVLPRAARSRTAEAPS